MGSRDNERAEQLMRTFKKEEYDYDDPTGRCGYFTVALVGTFVVCVIGFKAISKAIDTHRHTDYEHMVVTADMCQFLLTEKRQRFGKYMFTTVDYTALPKDPSASWTNVAKFTIRLKTLLTDERMGKGDRAIIVSGYRTSLIVVLDEHWNHSPSPNFLDDIHKELDGEQTTRVVATTGNTTMPTKFWFVQELKLDGDDVRLRCITEKFDGPVNHLRMWDADPIVVGPLTDKIRWRISILGLKDQDHKLLGKFATCKYRA